MTQEIAMCQACGAEMLRLSASEHVCLECPPAHDEVFTLDLSAWPAGSQVAPDMALPSIPTEKDAHVEAHQDSAGLDLPGHDQERDLGAMEGAAAMVGPGVDAAGRCRAQGGDTKPESLTDGQIDRILAMVPLYSDDTELDKRRRWARAIESAVIAPLAATTQASTAQAEADRLRTALKTIARWELPRTGKTWDDGTPMSYGAAFGSNGERDYMRQVALDALAATSSTDAQAAAAVDELKRERDRFERMFVAACADLGLVNEALGLDPDDGGAEPILAAIEELRAATATQGAQAAAEVRDAWVSVDERLPEDGQAVAFVVDSNGWERFDYLTGRVLGGAYNKAFGGFSVPGMTIGASYWMPLPLPPAPDAIRGAGNTGSTQLREEGSFYAVAKARGFTDFGLTISGKYSDDKLQALREQYDTERAGDTGGAQ